MIDMKLNRKRLGLHWQYYRVRYIVLLIVALAAANFLLSATSPKTPANQRVDVLIVSSAYSSEALGILSKTLLSQLPPDQREVNVNAIPMIEGQDMNMLIAARMAAGEGTLWILPANLFAANAQAGAFLALDDQIGSFNLPEGLDLANGRVMLQKEENKPAVQTLCGIPLDKCKGLSGTFVPEGMVLAFPSYTDVNRENAKLVANYLLSLTGDFVEASSPMGTGFGFFVASQQFKSFDTDAWQKAVQDGLKPEPPCGVSLVPFAAGREATVADALIARAANYPSKMCLVPRAVFAELLKKNALMPLDDAFHLFRLPQGADVSAGRAVAEKDGKPVGAEQLYGIPLDGFAGFSGVFDAAGMVLVFPQQPGEALSVAIDAANLVLGTVQQAH